MMNRVVVGSAPFFPPLGRGERIIAVVQGITIDKVKHIIDRAAEVVSFCGHQETAAFLGVPYCRDAAPTEYFRPGTVWVGIRPIDRPMPGEEVKVDPSQFVGWKMTFLWPRNLGRLRRTRGR
jgi:hypothetical protein